MLSIILLSALAAAGDSLLANGTFDESLEGWQAAATGVTFDVSNGAVSITVPDETAVAWPMVSQQLAAQPGDVYEARVKAAGRNVRDGFGVYIALEFWREGERIAFAQSGAASGDGDWSELRLRSVVPPQAEAVRLCLLLNGHGTALFDDATLRRVGNVSLAPLSGPVTLTVTDDVVCESLVGFGAEDDGWFFSEENAAHGVDAADAAVRERRIEYMDPDWVRMFFWYRDWNPSGDWQTFDFDTPNMLSHYKTLDTYQRLGTVINAVGVEWGIQDPYADPPAVAKAIGALFEHLIKERGYTCVQQWTLTNEPNGAFASHMGYTFERFVELHRLVAEEFAGRKLDITIIGSDDTGSLPWFTQCVEDDTYHRIADLYASHRYLPYQDRVLASYFFEDRLEALRANPPLKPFTVAEFGFQDNRSGTLENPIMETYPYAVWTTGFIIEGLNRGVAGFNIWCLHETYYPGNGFMNYGLWEYKDDNWRIRPVYHAMANFSRFTERGDRVLRCESSHPNHVDAAMINDTLFWVNKGEQEVQVTLEGRDLTEGRVYTESSVYGDEECGEVVAVEDGGFTAPHMSFGWLR